MNKSVIGNRMKRSGMHWSEQAATNRAALRAQICAKKPLVDFDFLILPIAHDAPRCFFGKPKKH